MSGPLFDQMMEHNDFEDIRETYIRAPFNWLGNKYDSLDYILPKLPQRKVFVDCYAGSGTVALSRKPSKINVINDRHKGIVAFYRILKDKIKLKLFIERLQFFVNSREEFIWCKDTWELESGTPTGPENDIERAARWYYTVLFSFAGAGRNYGRATTGNGAVWNQLSSKLHLFPLIHEKLQCYQIENLSAEQCIKDYDSPETVFYCDPPYHGKNWYVHKMDHEAHIRLCNLIFQSKGFFALSGYDNPVYDDPKYPWDNKIQWKVKDIITTQSFTKTGQTEGMQDTIKRGKLVEYLWIKEAQD